jgi:hypothetical protein
MFVEGDRPSSRERLPAVPHLVWNRDVGGMERLVHEFARCQRASGMEVTVAFGQDRAPFAESIGRARSRWTAERFPIDRTASSYLCIYRSALAEAQ